MECVIKSKESVFAYQDSQEHIAHVFEFWVYLTIQLINNFYLKTEYAQEMEIVITEDTANLIQENVFAMKDLLEKIALVWWKRIETWIINMKIFFYIKFKIAQMAVVIVEFVIMT